MQEQMFTFHKILIYIVCENLLKFSLWVIGDQFLKHTLVDTVVCIVVLSLLPSHSWNQCGSSPFQLPNKCHRNPACYLSPGRGELDPAHGNR